MIQKILFILILIFIVFLISKYVVDIFKNFTNPSIVNMKTYRVDEKPDGISSKNSGDLIGDNSYISGEFCSRHPTECKSGILTEYNVLYNNKSGFGPYAYCNPGGIVGGTGKYKCSCDAHKLKTGECLNLPGKEQDRFSGGNWYSWPEELECLSEQNIGDNGCKWKIVGKPKSVNIDTLEQHGYKSLSKSEYDQWKSDKTKKTSQYVKQNMDKNIEIIKKYLS